MRERRGRQTDRQTDIQTGTGRDLENEGEKRQTDGHR